MPAAARARATAAPMRFPPVMSAAPPAIAYSDRDSPPPVRSRLCSLADARSGFDFADQDQSKSKRAAAGWDLDDERLVTELGR